MEVKAYSEAAVLYEKYLRVLEIIYEIKAGDLTPQLFANRARSKELGLISMVFWDLVRIYDASPRYGDRQHRAALKLAEFCKAAPSVGKKIVQQAQDFLKVSKNPVVIKNLIKQAGFKKGGCFIATVAFQSPFASEVVWLQAFRDQVLEKSWPGKAFISTYYLISPPIARFLAHYQILQKPVRFFLKRVVTFLKSRFNLIIGPNF
jgi:hypothetical protein